MKLDVARIVKALRVARGLTQEQLAHELSVTFGTVNGWENRGIARFPRCRTV